MTLRLFYQQSFMNLTNLKKSSNNMNSFINIVKGYKDKYKTNIDVLPYDDLKESKNYQQIFKKLTKLELTSNDYEDYKYKILKNSHGIIMVKNSISEYSAYEMGYIRAKFPQLPIFYAVDKTLSNNNLFLKNSDNIIFHQYSDPEDLKNDLHQWIKNINNLKMNFELIRPHNFSYVKIPHNFNYVKLQS